MSGYFYNPNIHPYQEYQKRLVTVQEFSGIVGCEVQYRDEYDLDSFLSCIVGRGASRCEHCYRMRLDAAGGATRKNGIALMTTSLLYSRYQQHDLIIGLGKEMASEHGVEFYYEDFRQGWHKGINESKIMGLYRQQYCGCLYSERERFEKTPQARNKDLRKHNQTCLNEHNDRC